jgi:hypothetical protein
MTRTPREFTPVTQLLNEDLRNTLSKPAQDIFEITWNNLNWHRKTSYYWTDVECSRHARTQLRYVEGARQELVDAGLFDITMMDTFREGFPVFRFKFLAEAA